MEWYGGACSHGWESVGRKTLHPYQGNLYLSESLSPGQCRGKPTLNAPTLG